MSVAKVLKMTKVDMMNDKVLVSILVPIYNVEKYIEKCSVSLFTQTYKNLEYVFVDDCCQDNSIDVLENVIRKHGIPNNRYTIVRHPQNEGIAVSRADCIGHARGEYILFVDSDDWIERNMVEALVNATNGGEIDIVACDYMKDYISGEITYHDEDYASTCHENLIRSINYDISTLLWKLLIRRELFSHFTITPHVDIVEDYIMTIKLYYYAKSFTRIRQYLYHYVQYNQGRVSFQTQRSIMNHIKGVREVETFCREKGLCDERVENLLNLRKFNIKSNFLTKRMLDYKAYQETFPEANGTWHQLDYSRKECLKFWLAEHSLFSLLKYLQKI